MAEEQHDDLVRDLVTLGHGVGRLVAPDSLTSAVMSRVATLPTPERPRSGSTRSWQQAARGAGVWVTQGFESRRRRIALVVCAVLLALLATPPVRAAVADWFGFGGVLVEKGSPRPGPARPPPEVAQDRSVTEAAASVDFTVHVPAELGAPDGVEVSPDGRLVSMSWSSDDIGVVRLDQFDARFDWSVLKRALGVSYTVVGGSDALWFDEPHEVVLLEPDGSRRTEPPRLAGHTLIWLDGDTTLRLEGDLGLERAIEIAESSAAVG